MDRKPATAGQVRALHVTVVLFFAFNLAALWLIGCQMTVIARALRLETP